jgi:transcriptional regulator with XRE-family HTH domain
MEKLTLGQKVRFFRKRKKISQLELELTISAAGGSISRIENDVVNPTKETLFEIAEAFKLTSHETAYLFGIVIEEEKAEIPREDI